MHTKSITPIVRFVQIKPGYRVGHDGSVWSCIKWRRGERVIYGEWRRLKASPQYRGHRAVELGRKDYRFVHRLVLEAFVGPCPEGMECRHLDGNPGNNELSNLIWGTRLANHQDMIRHGRANYFGGNPCRSGRPVGSGKLTPEDVAEIRANAPKDWQNPVATNELAMKFDVSPAYIKMIARGERCQKVK